MLQILNISISLFIDLCILLFRRQLLMSMDNIYMEALIINSQKWYVVM